MRKKILIASLILLLASLFTYLRKLSSSPTPSFSQKQDLKQEEKKERKEKEKREKREKREETPSPKAPKEIPPPTTSSLSPLQEYLRLEKVAHEAMRATSPSSAFEVLKKLKEKIIMNPSHGEIQKKADIFYENCARHKLYSLSLRSFCLFEKLSLAKDRGEKIDLKTYPQNIRKKIILK